MIYQSLLTKQLISTRQTTVGGNTKHGGRSRQVNEHSTTCNTECEVERMMMLAMRIWILNLKVTGQSKKYQFLWVFRSLPSSID